MADREDPIPPVVSLDNPESGDRACDTSGSPSPPLRGWSLVNQSGEVETCSDDSSSGSDFVQMENSESVSFHPKTKSRSGSSSSSGSLLSAGIMADVEESWSSTDMDEMTLQASKHDLLGEDVTEPLIFQRELNPDDCASYDVAHMSTNEAISSDDSQENDEEESAPAMVDLEVLTESDEEGAVKGDSGTVVVDAAVAAAALVTEAEYTRGGDEGSGGLSSSSIEHLSAPGEGEESEVLCGGVSASRLLTEQQGSGRVHLDSSPSTSRHAAVPSTSGSPLYPGVHYRPLVHRQFSESDSENSDFVRIDHPRFVPAAHDLLQASTSSSSSSVSANFRFLQPVNMAANYDAYRQRVEEEDDDDASLPSDVDDRCESDISGVVFDSSDPDLSSVAYADLLDNIPLTAGDVRRSYKHKPNSNLNAFLTLLALLTLFTALGIGIGHYMGSVREMNLHLQQVANMKALQDDYLLCLRKQQELQGQVSSVNEDRIQAIAAIWKEKYEQLIIEKADLETSYRQLRHKYQGIDEDINLMASKLRYEEQRNTELHQQLSNQSLDDATQDLFLEKKMLNERELELNEKLNKLNVEQDARQAMVWELKSQLQEMQDRNQELQGQLATAVVQLKVQKDAEVKLQESIAIEFAMLRQDLNSAQNANLDLQEEVAKMRYGAANVVVSSTSHEMKTEPSTIDQANQPKDRLISLEEELIDDFNSEYSCDVNTEYFTERNNLRVENEDLKLVVGKLRYTEKTTDDGQITDAPAKAFAPEMISVSTQTLSTESGILSPEDMLIKLQILQKEVEFMNNVLDIEKKQSQALELRLAEEKKQWNNSMNHVTFTQCMQLIASNITENLSLQSFPESFRDVFNMSDTLHRLGDVVHHIKSDPTFESIMEKANSALLKVQKVAEDTTHVLMEHIDTYTQKTDPQSDLTKLDKEPNSDVFSSGDDDCYVVETDEIEPKVIFASTQTDEEVHEPKMKDASTQTEDTSHNRISGTKVIGMIEAGIDNNNNDINNNKLGETQKYDNNDSEKKERVHFGANKANKKNKNKMKDKKHKNRKLKGDKNADGSQQVNVTARERLEQFVNQTKESVVALTEKVQRTWHRVKNLSTELLGEKENSPKETAKALGNAVMQSVDKFKKETSRVWKAAWKEIKHGNGWLGRRQSNKNEKKRRKENKNRKNKKGYVQFEDAAFLALAQNKKKVENKPQHHRKESSTNADTEYEQFWNKADFQPDDFLHDEFWEGNDREWRKHQRKFRKIHGRLYRLNEELFLAMDDDDIEDFYDDLDDLQDDAFGNGHLKPEKLKAWLTCQLRWWKSRMYRKHGHDDLVKGCVSQLLRWQLTTLCRAPPICHTKKCKRQIFKDKRSGKFAQKSKWCQYLEKTVMMSNQGRPQEGGATIGAHDSHQNHFQRSHSSSQDIVFDDFSSHIKTIRLPKASDSSSRHTQGTIHTPHGRFNYHIDLDGNDDDEDENQNKWKLEDKGDDNSTSFDKNENLDDHSSAAEEDDWYSPQNDNHSPKLPESPHWVFERAEDRESRHNPGVWYFQRADERHFERTKPWYYKRADGRKELHSKWDQNTEAP